MENYQKYIFIKLISDIHEYVMTIYNIVRGNHRKKKIILKFYVLSFY